MVAKAMSTESDLKTFISPAGGMVMQLRERINGGGYPLGSALPTERDLCSQFGVSRWTVRQALKVLEREHLIVRQQGRGTFVTSSLDSTPAINLQAGLIGLLLWEVEYVGSGLVQGTCSAAADRGYAVTTGSVHSFTEESQSVRAFVRNNTLGVVLAARSPSTRSYCGELTRENIAVVLVDMLIPGCHEDYVLVDNAHGTILATTHLIELGHRRIAHVTHNGARGDDPPISVERRRGYLETCRQGGLETPEHYVVATDEASYRDQLRTLLSSQPRPTAVVAYNDLWAIRVIQVARSMGMEVPRDLSVVGFDDSVMAPAYDVPLTTINPERHEMGVTAVELLLDKIERRAPRPGRGILIAPRLVLRQSTAAPPGY
jgi:GntR family transcriptional regulator of arabinose operon